MSAHEVNTRWTGGMSFDSTIGDHIIHLDNSLAGGGNNTGPTPKPLLLSAIAGCSAMDVVSILNKMKVDFSNLNIHVTGELSETIPKVYTTIHLNYKIHLDASDQEKMNRAVNLSLEKYCGVSFMLSKACTITHSITFI